MMKTLRSLLLILFPVAAALLVGCSPSGDSKSTGGRGSSPDGSLDMKFQWLAGKEYHFRMVMDQTSESQVPNMSEPIKQHMVMSEGYSISVLRELEDGGRELQLTFTGMTMDMNMGDRSVISFDSSQDEADDLAEPVTAVLRKFVGGQVKLITDRDANVQRVEGGTELVNRILEGSPQQLRAQFGSMFNEGFFRQIADFGKMSPGHPVKPGDTWKMHVEQEVGPAGVVVVDADMTFVDWETHGDTRCARIDSKGVITTRPDAANDTSPSMHLELSDSAATGQSWFDPALGMLNESVSDQSMKANVMMQNVSVDSQITQKVSWKLVDVADTVE